MDLKTMEAIVMNVLESSILAREDDYVLMWLVCDRLKPELCNKTFADVLYNHYALGLPNWETVTRCRRRIQEKHPELKVTAVAMKRQKKKPEYIAYSNM